MNTARLEAGLMICLLLMVASVVTIVIYERFFPPEVWSARPLTRGCVVVSAASALVAFSLLVLLTKRYLAEDEQQKS